MVKERNARAAAEVPTDQIAYILFDFTVFGSTRDCLVATEWGISYHQANENPNSFSMSYENLKYSVIANTFMGTKIGRFKAKLTGASRDFLQALQARLKGLRY
jgi:hypothetical protein